MNRKYKNKKTGSNKTRRLFILIFLVCLYMTMLYKTFIYAGGLATDHWLRSLPIENVQAISVPVSILPVRGLTIEEATLEGAENIIDKEIRASCEKYFSSRWKQNRCVALTHYLLFRESNYGESKDCGDGGRACGVMQFWQETYLRARREMIRKGLVSSLGSRENLYDAIETAIYMFSQGREHEWGPVYRGEINL